MKERRNENKSEQKKEKDAAVRQICIRSRDVDAVTF
jgi:hypothetical protein